MTVLDIRNIGNIDEKCEEFLALLIANTCDLDSLKHELSLCALRDFNWNGGNLISYVLAGYINDGSRRAHNIYDLDKSYISSGEWLNAIFVSGSVLSVEHMICTMSYIHPDIPANCFVHPYISCQKYWKDAPTPLKDLLDIIDDSIIKGEELTVIIPKVVPLNPEHTIEYLETIDLPMLKSLIRIEWE